jgi:succinate-acetate transporter protein
VVNTAVDATLEPIAPGLANVAPFKLLAFKLATLVVDATVNGAVPVVAVLVIVVKRPVLAVVEPIAPGSL